MHTSYTSVDEVDENDSHDLTFIIKLSNFFNKKIQHRISVAFPSRQVHIELKKY
jgi:hypothetical protein